MRPGRRRCLPVTVAVALTTMLIAAACEPPAPPSPAPLRPGEQPVRVMVVGDSFALSAGLGLDHYGTASGQMTVLNAALVGCGFGRGGRNRGIGLDRAWPAECQNRDARLLAMAGAFRPDVVVLAGGMWDVADRKLAGARRWTRIGVPAYDWYLALEFRHLSTLLAGTGAKVVWTTSPHWNPVYRPELFMGRPPYAEAAPARADRYNQVLAATVASTPGVSLIDLAGWMRAFPGGEFAPALRTDGVHFTTTSTDRVASEFLGPWLVAVGRS